MVIIDTPELAWIRGLLQRNVETCGHMSVSGSKLYLEEKSTSSVAVGDRPFCRNPYRAEYMFHTHPTGVKAYLSAEDIMNILKLYPKGNVRTEMMFSTWGIFELTAQRKSKFVPERLQAHVQWLEDILAHVYRKTDRGRVLPGPSTTFMRYYIDQIEQHFWEYGLRIEYTPWQKIGGSYMCRFIV